MAFPVVAVDQVVKVHANERTQCVEEIRFETCELRLPAVICWIHCPIAPFDLRLSAALRRFIVPSESSAGMTCRCRSSLKKRMDGAFRARLDNSSQHSSSLSDAPRRCNCTRVYAAS